MLQDIPFREYAHSYPVADCPFGDITVGIAAMIGKTANSSALGRIYELRTK